MKTREQAVRALAQTAEDKMLLQQFFDKYEVSQERSYLTHTRFLDLRERTLCVKAARETGITAQTVFWGGYPDAERVMALFLPDYLTAEDAIKPENSPLALLRAEKSPADTLSHRDYLGALMGLGIERAVVGDILLHDDGAELFVAEDMAEFILMNFLRAGRKRVMLSQIALTDFPFARGQ